MSKKTSAPTKVAIINSNVKKRKGVHSKKKSSKLKSSKNYIKAYRGQGR
jgi:hypothetical protein